MISCPNRASGAETALGYDPMDGDGARSRFWPRAMVAVVTNAGDVSMAPPVGEGWGRVPIEP